MIEIRLPVLEKHDTWKQQIEKLQEETGEVIEEIRALQLQPHKKQAIRVLGEVLDVLQVLVGIIEDTTEHHDVKLKDVELEHVEKLYRRGWSFRKMIRIEEE